MEAPEFDREFHGYELPEPSQFARSELPPEPEIVLEDGRVYLPEPEVLALQIFVERAYEQQAALDAREDQVRELEIEVRKLVQAGVLTEQQLAIVSEMYENEARECRWVRFSAYGIAGLSFVILGIGAL